MFKAGKGGKKAGSTKARDLAGEAGVLAAGWLQKRGEGNRSYKRRFCIVSTTAVESSCSSSVDTVNQPTKHLPACGGGATGETTGGV